VFNDKNSLPFEQWEIELVKKKARRLIGKYGFSETDRHDLEQELLLHMFVRRSVEKYSGGSFIEQQDGLSRLLDNKLRKIKEYAMRDKRSVHLRKQALTEEFEETISGEPAPHIVSEEDANSLAVFREPGLRDELIDAMRLLTPPQKIVCQKLMEGYGINEIAKMLGRVKTTVFRHIWAIREILEKQGFGK
jgi:DNA-directed RNA polymerase specialized sigma24 family protein